MSRSKVSGLVAGRVAWVATLLALAGISVSSCGDYADTSSDRPLTSNIVTSLVPFDTLPPPAPGEAGNAQSHDEYIHRIKLGDFGLESTTLADAIAQGNEAPIPLSWPDPDAVRVALDGEAGVIMVWEESPYGLVAITTSDAFTRSENSFEDFIKGAVTSLGGTAIRVRDVDGVILASEHTTSVLFMRDSWWVAVESDAEIGTEAAIELAALVLDAP